MATADLETLVDANSPTCCCWMAAKARRAPSWKSSQRGVAVTAVIDDGHDRRLAGDFAYYPPVPRRAGAGLDRRRARVPRIGWEWALLGLNPNAARHARAARRAPPCWWRWAAAIRMA